jgi:soluble lytic murein transglycosylase
MGRHEEALRALRAAYPDWRCREDVPASAWCAAYPVAYADLVLEHGGSEGVDPALLFALIHQESVFRSEAVSWAGARGLMQIMPATGRVIARWMGEGRSPDLMDPALNVRYGTRYLRKLLDEFERPELALAGYNAGGGRVRRWWKALPEDDVPLFVESIPFDETRDYVKAILWNRMLYRVTRGVGGPGWSGAVVARLDDGEEVVAR